jgi:N-acetylglutamate synthase
VRRVAEIRGGRPVFSDTVGVLTSWSDNVLIITRRDGEIVRIAESAVVAGKAVPNAPARRRFSAPSAAPAELAGIAARGWPALKTERLGDWLLRASQGFTRRANSVLALGDPGVPADEALRRVTAWYGERGLTPCAQVVTGSRTAGAFADHGWGAGGHTLLRTAPLAPVADGPGAEQVTLSRELDAAWLAAYHRVSGLEEAARGVLRGGASVWFATVPDPADPGRPAAIGRCVADGRWALFCAVEVSPAHRRQGLATAVMTALAGRALAEGAYGALLQVEADNAAGCALYDRMGFGTVERYHYCGPHSGMPPARQAVSGRPDAG